jgi:hypothetical protein
MAQDKKCSRLSLLKCVDTVQGSELRGKIVVDVLRYLGVGIVELLRCWLD